MSSTVNGENFEGSIETGVALVDFWAEWCGPCRMLGPIIEELGAELAGRVRIYKCNVDDCPDLAGKFNVRSIPTLILFRDGEVVDTSVGALSKAAIGSWLESKL